MKQQIILASASPWRKRLLARHGIRCRTHLSGFIEKTDHTNPKKMVLFNARGKAMAVAAHYKRGIVIGVDTIGVIGKKYLFKAKNRTDASRMIRTIAGRRHKVISGLCVINCSTKKCIQAVVTTFIKFRKIGRDELKKYLDSNQWRGKAGSYAIQGRAKGFVEKIEGDVTNVIGLPIPTLKKILAGEPKM